MLAELREIQEIQLIMDELNHVHGMDDNIAFELASHHVDNFPVCVDSIENIAREIARGS